MGFDRHIASLPVRILTGLAVAAFIFVAFLYFRPGSTESGSVSLVPLLVLGVAAAIGCIFSFRRIYDAWMHFAELLSAVMSTLLFGACYLMIVPFFAAFVRVGDPLKLSRKHDARETYWIHRSQDDADPTSYQRMG